MDAAFWVNEPPEWTAEGDTLSLTTAPGSDFWRHTHYEFVRDSGHLLAHRVEGDLVAEVTVTADYRDQFDQAGLMLRLDETRWLKCGIEHVDGEQRFSTVVTNGWSDWSMLPLEPPPDALRVRVSRRGDAVTVEYGSSDGYRLHRIAYMPAAESVLVGPMAASPDGQGLRARFTDLRITPLNGDDEEGS